VGSGFAFWVTISAVSVRGFGPAWASARVGRTTPSRVASGVAEALRYRSAPGVTPSETRGGGRGHPGLASR